MPLELPSASPCPTKKEAAVAAARVLRANARTLSSVVCPTRSTVPKASPNFTARGVVPPSRAWFQSLSDVPVVARPSLTMTKAICRPARTTTAGIATITGDIRLIRPDKTLIPDYHGDSPCNAGTCSIRPLIPVVVAPDA